MTEALAGVRAVLSCVIAHQDATSYPAACFEEHCTDGYAMRLLHGAAPDSPAAHRLHNLIEFGVSECLERRCLDALTFTVHDTATGSLRRLVLRFAYAASGMPASPIVPMLKQVALLLETLQPIPSPSFVQLTLRPECLPYPSWKPAYYVPPSSLPPNATSLVDLPFGTLRTLDGVHMQCLLQATTNAASASVPAFDAYFDLPATPARLDDVLCLPVPKSVWPTSSCVAQPLHQRAATSQPWFLR
ncbi:hypothetical protein SPRG_00836 [Saprolegnia parasitica CBS 223.65]|uniref:Uncharacterized protein n=1 Tax=Saprolegnia parasitica (strain CBS 223.65) TaxID=695850 RepID=A0A067CZU5_SAPPC|nr:hypothetical protein SPRG_00836 [Saprolegnia parasitica CBS 223.65]KDO34775.1 hypothetical protein SPRG_00836 [Saprolegnia parasitica CBS 223.65]|eukprot:XP_012194442.1 hypothetical protein SPRG_00836 [Saprolegnia parasitica CBS 223.65]